MQLSAGGVLVLTQIIGVKFFQACVFFFHDQFDSD